MILKNAYKLFIFFCVIAIYSSEGQYVQLSDQLELRSNSINQNINNDQIITQEQIDESLRLFNLSKRIWINSLQIKTFNEKNLFSLFPHFYVSFEKIIFTKYQADMISEKFRNYFHTNLVNSQRRCHIYNNYIESHGVLLGNLYTFDTNEFGDRISKRHHAFAMAESNCFKDLTEDQLNIIGCLNRIACWDCMNEFYRVSISYKEIVNELNKNRSDIVTHEYVNAIMNTFEQDDYEALVAAFNLKENDCCCVIM